MAAAPGDRLSIHNSIISVPPLISMAGAPLADWPSPPAAPDAVPDAPVAAAAINPFSLQRKYDVMTTVLNRPNAIERAPANRGYMVLVNWLHRILAVQLGIEHSSPFTDDQLQRMNQFVHEWLQTNGRNYMTPVAWIQQARYARSYCDEQLRARGLPNPFSIGFPPIERSYATNDEHPFGDLGKRSKKSKRTKKSKRSKRTKRSRRHSKK